MIEGTYVQKIKVKNLPEGYEYQPNRFITDKTMHGCHVTYRSQEGDIRYINDHDKVSLNYCAPLWWDANTLVDCQVDFVPDSHREKWVQLQKLGKCYMAWTGRGWKVVYPENPTLNDTLMMDAVITEQRQAISDAMYIFSKDWSSDRISEPNGLVHNGYRWFDCRDTTNFKKISDDEARKLNG